jgi:predicted transcriptional regulator
MNEYYRNIPKKVIFSISGLNKKYFPNINSVDFNKLELTPYVLHKATYIKEVKKMTDIIFKIIGHTTILDATSNCGSNTISFASKFKKVISLESIRKNYNSLVNNVEEYNFTNVKMFNDDWMRDRGFLEIKKPKAIDLISSHKNQKLLTVDSSASVSDALAIMNKYGISQIPVKNGDQFVGSLNDSFLFSKLIEDSSIKTKIVSEVMQAPFPIVSDQTLMEDISKLITRENNAVLMTDLAGTTHIITKHDLIQGISQMSN